MDGFIKMLAQMPAFGEITDAVQSKKTPVNVIGVSDSMRAHMAYSVCKKLDACALVIAHNEVSARQIYEDLRFFDENVLLFPKSELLFYDVEAMGRDIMRERLNVIDKLHTSPDKYHVITTIEALRGVTVPRGLYEEYTLTLKVGGNYPLDDISNALVTLGYEREEIVEGQGQFCIRGGIVDFFPFSSSMAYRIEFFDDEVDSIRLFDIDNQRTVDKVKEARITPAEEIILTSRMRNDLIEKLRAFNGADKDIEKLSEGINIRSVSKYIPLLYDGNEGYLTDYISDKYIVFFDEPARVHEAAHASDRELVMTVKEYMSNGGTEGANSRSYVMKDLDKSGGGFVCDYNALVERLKSRAVVGLSAISHASPDYRAKKIVDITSKSLTPFHGKIEFFYDAVYDYLANNYRVIILAHNEATAKRISQSLMNELPGHKAITEPDGPKQTGLSIAYVDELDNLPPCGSVTVTHGVLCAGFEYPSIKTAVISDKEILGGGHTGHKKPRRSGRDKRNKIDSFTDLSIGDYVVHQSHGIGQYMGIKKLVVSGVTKDYIQIRYSGEDLLYVPAEQLDYVYKYIGKDGAGVRLNKLGGADWNRAKQRVKKACADMAQELVELYAAREEIKGIQYSKDNEFQKQFDDSFEYDETDDQLRSIEEVKLDMQRSRPMDRLLCGDVGYGKTEVAIRAAFKAVLDGYQVAYLAPTTILVNQHYNTFRKRMKDFAVNVEMLSRFRTAAEQKNILKKLKTGEIDIVIGTHRLIQKDVAFKKPGLLIIDEEQRFGVSHKEKIKEMRKEIDVLTLTATPIPRTLHMSLAGIRDMSIIGEPPRDRYPIGTYVLEYDEQVIRDAIAKEIGRGGQVYYLYNRVQGIHRKANRLTELIPGIRVGIGHGQMNETELENVMMDLLDGEIDVLVCTTIIETGLDVPNVNTIIIEDADKMGLAQLYQLRGRVGRSNKLAYAYLTFRRDKVLSEVAEKRLRAIKEFTEFGSGFKIALRDLEIRGAGNIIGAQQHGHMDAVGYDMYCKLLSEAVRELKNEPEEKKTETLVDISVNAYIPEDYISAHSQRIQAYKRIAAIEEQNDLYDAYEEMEDRYGTVPECVNNLMEIALIKNRLSMLKITEFSSKEDEIVCSFDTNDPPNMQKIVDLMQQNPNKISIHLKAATPNFRVRIKKTKNADTEYINEIKNFLLLL